MMEIEIIRHKADIFKQEAPKVTIGQLLGAMLSLTDIEFRAWLNALAKFESFDPSHFQGLEEQYLQTGKWDWVDVEVG